MEISKTLRILSVYHLFRYCEEISYKEVIDLMPISSKTIYRDIRFLEQAGLLQPRYSKKRRAIIDLGGTGRPNFPSSKTQRRYFEKIIRLCTLMRDLDGTADPVAWYREHYPKLTDRTRQRDFEELNKIGYLVTYQRWDDGDEEHPVGSTYCDFPYDAYSLYTFTERGF
ncbi:hypothetical protein V6615_11330 [Oscillospiraceae bacterium PP1C4]